MEGSVSELSAYLVAPARDDFERARAIFRWITQNISYDFQAYLSKDYGDQSAKAVLARRTGVCSGYANLFQALAQAAGVEAVVVGGWSKGYGYVANVLEEDTNHAWNAVRIDGEWYLIESTWGAGSITEDKEFVPRFNGYYFLVPPQQLIYTHFPEESRWQLLDSPVGGSDFESRPRVWPSFFDNEIGLESHPGGLIRTEGEIAVILSAPQDVLLLARVKQGDAELPERLTFVHRDGDAYNIQAVFPAAGEYTLSVYSKRAGAEGTYPQSLEYTVQVSQGLPHHPGFPIVWPSFFDNEIGLESHPGGLIRTEGEIAVILSAPQDVLLLARVKQGDAELPERLTFIHRDGDAYNIQAVFPAAGEYTLSVYSKRAGTEGTYPQSLEYTVQVSQGLPHHPGFPIVWPSFFDNGMGLESHPGGLIRTEGEIAVILSTSQDVLLLARVKQGDAELPERLTFVHRDGDAYNIQAVFPAAGEYTLSVYSKRAGAEGTYPQSLEYAVQVSQGLPHHPGFPVAYVTFLERAARLYGPMTGLLPSGSTQRFRLDVPGAEAVVVIVGEQWYHLKYLDGLYQGEATITATEVRVGARFPGDESYHILLLYSSS